MSKQTISLPSFACTPNNQSTNQAAYLELGQGRPIIFLHGFLGEASAWLPIMQELKSEFRCLALDLLGFGGSSKPNLKYTIWHQVQFLHQFITALDLKNFDLVGHSYGGWTAAAYAIHPLVDGNIRHWQPDLFSPNPDLRAIALVAPAGIRDDDFVGRYNYLKPLLWQNPLVDVGLNLIARLHKSPKWQPILEARRALVNQPVARSFLYDRWRPEDAIDTVEKYIHTINVPTLIIAGQQDDTIPLWHCQTYADQIRQSKIKILPEAGHSLLQTDYAAIADLLRSPNN